MKRIHFVAVALAALVSACAGSPDPVVAPLTPPSETAAEPDWEATLERVVPCVVSLRMVVPRSFDTSRATSTSGTGFIVDREKGLLVTNRHLVMPGPVRAKALFQNREEVNLRAVYRDPVHDFGFYQFDPSVVEYAEICELELAPDAAKVGAEIKIVGNNAGEQISILGGTLARLDRQAPSYGVGNYNDFNTFYYQAASGTSGGSSGSPVFDEAGRVVALNAGSSRKAASSFFLPLQPVVRALELIRANQPIARGTLQTTFVYEPFDELARLNLSKETEDRARSANPDGKGLLVVGVVQPESPLDGLTQSGDIVVEINGELVPDFHALEPLLDGNVDQEIELVVERNGELLTLQARVDDLHRITPSEYIEVGGALIQTLSYQIARSYHAPVRGVYVRTTGYMLSAAGLPSSALIREIDGVPIESLDQFWDVVSALPDGWRSTWRYAPIAKHATEEGVRSVEIDRSWFPMQRCKLDPATGDWPCISAPEPPAATPDAQVVPKLTAAPLPEPDATIAPSLVMVEYDIPYRVEGVWGSYFRGSGLVVDAEAGIVIADRDTVPIFLGEAELTFGGVVRVPGRVVHIHPIHNLAVLQYDPESVAGLGIKAAEFTTKTVSEGDDIWLVGLDSRNQVASRKTTVDRVRPLNLPRARRPEFRDLNMEVITLGDRTSLVGGVLADKKGRVQGLWASFHMAGDDNDSIFRGMPAEVVRAIIDGFRTEVPRTLGVELGVTGLADARDLGLTDDWIEALAKHDPSRLEALTLRRLFHGSSLQDIARAGELLLAVDGVPVTRFFEVETATQKESVTLTLMRADGTIEDVVVSPTALSGHGVERVIRFAGALIHEPHLEVASQFGLAREGVYVAFTYYGGPAAHYGLRPAHRIIEANGKPTPDLDTFLAVVEELADGDTLRLKTLDRRNKDETLTLELDNKFWPLYELAFDEASGEWERRE